MRKIIFLGFLGLLIIMNLFIAEAIEMNPTSRWTFESTSVINDVQSSLYNWTIEGSLVANETLCIVGNCINRSGNASANRLIRAEFIGTNNNNGTFSLWFKGYGNIGGRGITGFITRWLLSAVNSTKFSASITDTTVINDTLNITNAWHLIVMRWNATGTDIFLDNVRIITFSAIVPNSGSDNDYILGSYQSGLENENMSIDEGLFFNRTLTNSELTRLYRRDYLDVLENYQSYNNLTFSSAAENFTINITYNSTFYTGIGAVLVYNNTNYTGKVIGSGNTVLLNAYITIPNVGAQRTIPFNWIVTLTNTTRSYNFNTTSRDQTVRNLSIDNCTTNTYQILNYTTRDEITQALTNATNTTINLNVEIYPVLNNTLFLNLTREYNVTNNARACLNSQVNNSYRLYAEVLYTVDTYIPKFHFIQNFTLNNNTAPSNNHILFNLPSSKSTDFSVSYKDKSFVAVENALINIRRRYVGEGVYKIVEVVKTDLVGQGVAHLSTNNIQYSFLITKEGKTLATFDNLAVFCEDPIQQKCNIKLTEPVSSVQPIDFVTYRNLNYNIAFNATARTVILTFNTLDSSTKTMTLNVTRADQYGNLSICQNSISASNGEIQCSIPNSYGNVSIFAKVYDGSDVIADLPFTIRVPLTDVLHSELFAFVIGIATTLPLIFIPSAIGVIIGSLVALLVIMGLVNITGVAGISMLDYLNFIIAAAFIIIVKIWLRGGD